MAIAFRASGAATAATAAVSPLAPGAPAGLTATDISILLVQGKQTTAGTIPTITTPSGWTLIGTVDGNGNTTSAVDAGSNYVGLYYRVGTYTAPSVTTSGFTSAGAQIHAYATSLASWDVSQTQTGSDTTAGTGTAITAAAGVDLATGDWLIVGAGLSGDTGRSAHSLAGATGATLGTQNLRSNTGISTGTDSATVYIDRDVTAGSSNVAPTFAVTTAGAQTAHARFLRLRDVAAAAADPAPRPVRFLAREAINRSRW